MQRCVTGAAFVRKNIQYAFNNISSVTDKQMRTWLSPCKPYWGADTLCTADRFVFFCKGIFFTPISWDGNEMKFINLENGKLFHPKIKENWFDEVQVLVPHNQM